MRTSRRVTERYSEALATAGIDARRSAIQMLVGAAEHDASTVLVETHLHPAGNEVFRAFVPTSVAQLSASDRARLVLEVVDAAMLRLAQERGWPLEACHRARQHTMEHGLTRWAAGGGWEYVVRGEITCSGPLQIVTPDYEPVGELTPGAGRFGIALHGRRSMFTEPDDPKEDHMLVCWPISN